MARKSKSEFEQLLDDVKGKHSKRMNAILVTSEDDEEFQVAYFKILEYASPKLQRTEIIEEAVEQKIVIEHSYPKEDKQE